MPASLYNMDKRLACAIHAVECASTLSQRKKELILHYKDEMLVNGLSKGRAARFTYYLLRLAEWIPCAFEEADMTVLKTVVSKIESSEYVPFSRMEHKLALRKFYKWLRGSEDYPPEVKWIRMGVRDSERRKLPEELLTEEEVRALINASKNPRDRALVAVLYESGARMGEVALLRFKHIQFDQYGAQLYVTGKTGPRRVRIISSVPLLAEWINTHPHRDDPGAFVWISKGGRCPSYSTISSVLTRLTKRAGIKKRIHAHLFRHSRATHLANHLTEAQMKEYFGWVQASRMAAVYVHLSGRNVDEALLRIHGIKKDDGEEPGGQLRPRACARCKTENPCTYRFCRLCGLPLTPEAGTDLLQQDLGRNEADDILDRMLEDPWFKEQFVARLNDVVGRRHGGPA